MYLGIFALLRLILKRETGTVGITDLIVVVLLGDAAQNGMAGQSKTVTDCLVLIITILFWAYILDWLAFRFPTLRRYLRHSPLLLVKDGKIQRRNMRRELITEEELMSLIREQGTDDLAQVKEAYMEGDGQISVVTNEKQGQNTRKRPKA